MSDGTAAGTPARPKRARPRRALRPTQVALLSSLVALALVLTPAATAAGAPGTIPVKITFSGSGTLQVDESYDYPESACQISTQDPISLHWRATFHALIVGGVLSGGGLGMLSAGPGYYAVATQITQGSLAEVPCEQVNDVPTCQGPLPSGAQPTFQILGGGDVNDPISFEAQSATSSPFASSCSPPVDVESRNDVAVLENALAGALTARAELPAKALLEGSASVPVSYADAPEQVGADCSGGEEINSYVPNTGCSASMDWSGTVSFEPDCGIKEQSIDCVKKQVKDHAAAAAREYGVRTKQNAFNYKVNCTGLAGKLTKKEPGGLAFCAGMSANWIYTSVEEQHFRHIAEDPPSYDYGHVAPPHPPRVARLVLLRHFAPATYRAASRALKVAGLAGAVTTALDRASGAYLALSEGDESAAAALAKQDRAALSYARKAARLLKGKGRLDRAAAAELRRLAASRQGHLAKGLRALAASLSAKPALAVDGLAAKSLSGISG